MRSTNRNGLVGVQIQTPSSFFLVPAGYKGLSGRRTRFPDIGLTPVWVQRPSSNCRLRLTAHRSPHIVHTSLSMGWDDAR